MVPVTFSHGQKEHLDCEHIVPCQRRPQPGTELQKTESSGHCFRDKVEYS